MNVVDVIGGDSAVVLGQPHGGTYVPGDLVKRLNANGAGLADTDWHITRLYDGLLDGVTVVKSNVHRYVVDANRDPSGQSLYPGQNTTTLSPLTDFDGRSIWREGQEPSDEEVEERRLAFHAPYHAALAAELARVKARHGVAILFDCHSIRSNIPFLFDGELPIFNTGTNLGTTCGAEVQQTVVETAQSSGRSAVVNGRFKGGWTTRHYGQPAQDVHAIQMEISQRAYMEETPPWAWCDDRAALVRPILQTILTKLNTLALSGKLS